MKSPGQTQLDKKYEFHDFVLEDLSPRDLDLIRQQAIEKFIKSSKYNENVTMIVAAFMDHLASRGYRIIKKEKT